MTREQAVAHLVRDLEAFSAGFVAAARGGDAGRVEEAVGGLVEWLGHDLVDAFFALDVATWEALSDLAEELLGAQRAAQERLGRSSGLPGPLVAIAQEEFDRILRRARLIRDGKEIPCP